MQTLIKNIWIMTKALFTYVPDSIAYPRKFDDWREHADAVHNGIPFQGDCDDFAMTCAECLMQAGFPKDKIRLAQCHLRDGSQHLVCIADGYVMDNIVDGLYPWNQLDYKWLNSMVMSEPGIWREMK